LLPALTIENDELKEGLDILGNAILDCVKMRIEAGDAKEMSVRA